MCHYVSAWQRVASGSYNLVYCLSFADTWGFSLAYGIGDVTGEGAGEGAGDGLCPSRSTEGGLCLHSSRSANKAKILFFMLYFISLSVKSISLKEKKKN